MILEHNSPGRHLFWIAQDVSAPKGLVHFLYKTAYDQFSTATEEGHSNTVSVFHMNYTQESSPPVLYLSILSFNITSQ